MPCKDLFVCVLLCSMNFGAQDVALKGRRFQSVPAASQYAFEKVLKIFHPYFTGRIVICIFQGR